MPYAMLYSDESGANWITLKTQWTDKDAVKTVPGSRWDPSLGLWKVPRSWAACVMLRAIFGTELQLDQSVVTWAWEERRNRIEPANVLRMQTDAGDDINGKFRQKLYSFQSVGVDFLQVGGNVLLGDEMGTGKTIQMLTALREQYVLGAPTLPAVVICPNSTKYNWAKETERWFPEALPVIIEGSAVNKRKIFDGLASHSDNALVIINIEAVRLHSRLAPYGSTRLRRCRECDKKYGEPDLTPNRCEVHHKELNRIPFRTVIIDEAHRIKEPSSKQTRACWAVGQQSSVVRRWAATGTPLANDPSDLWSIMHFVEPTEYPTRTKFVDRYALSEWNSSGGLSVVGLNPEHKQEFYTFFDPRFRAMPKALVLDQLPPKVRETRYVEMTPKQRKAYDEISTGLITRLSDGTLLVAPNNLSAQIRLLQLSSSYATIDVVDPSDPSTWIVTLTDPSPKVDELESLCDDISGQFVVSAEHRQLIMLASKRLTKLHIPHGLIVGGMSPWEREKTLEDFQSGKTRVLLFTLKAGGTGLTMTAAGTMVCLQRSWSMIDNKQGEDRVHRIGSERHDVVNIIDVVTRNSVEDQVQIPRLMEKLERLEEITRQRAMLVAAGRSTLDVDNEETIILGSNLGVA